MDYIESCQYSFRLLKKLESLDVEHTLDFNLIKKAIYWARKHHNGQVRKTGEDFYTHPLEVAYIASDYSLKTEIIVAAILHDIVEDTEVTAGMILDEFGRRIEEIVDRLTRDRPDGTKLTVQEILNNAYKKGDKDVLLIKCIDRLHNIQTIGAKSPEKIEKTINETITMFILLSIYLEEPQIENLLLQQCFDNLSMNTKLSDNINHLSIFNSEQTHGSFQLLSQVFESEAPHMYKILKQEE